jgi:hypothetical protein
MLTALRQGRVSGLRVTVACAETLDQVPHDVYLLDLSPLPSGAAERFDEMPYLELLEPVLDAAGGPPSWVVDVSRSHRSDRDGMGAAHLSVALALGRKAYATDPDPDLTGLVQAALGGMVGAGSTAPGSTAPEPLSRGDAVTAATGAVGTAFAGVDVGSLSLTEEEHHPALGQWSLGLAVPGEARFQVLVGLVPGVPASAHVRRMPVSEVVDSVGP